MKLEAKCWDCQISMGEPHDEGCDVARCLWTGGQRLTCDALEHNCGADVHTGCWPGEAEGEEFGWYSYDSEFGPKRCEPERDGAMVDLNRLHLRQEARWDRGVQRWVLR